MPEHKTRTAFLKHVQLARTHVQGDLATPLQRQAGSAVPVAAPMCKLLRRQAAARARNEATVVQPSSPDYCSWWNLWPQ